MNDVIFILVCIANIAVCEDGFVFQESPMIHTHPCQNSTDIMVAFDLGQVQRGEIIYNVYVNKLISVSTQVLLEFDAEADVKLHDETNKRISYIGFNTYNIRFRKKANSLGFSVKRVGQGRAPYFDSFKIDDVEYCANPKKGYMDRFIKKTNSIVETTREENLETCGRRKVLETALIVNGEATKPGDWPWHVAIYRYYTGRIQYICGGTLISKNFVLTAAHCASIRNNAVLPESLSVVLGKYNLVGGDTASEEKKVHQIILHDRFNERVRLNNDIALLKLATEVVFNDYIQPACLWYEDLKEKLPTSVIYGRVPGWGLDHTDQPTRQLQQVTLPIVSKPTCVDSNPVYFADLLDENKFCAGWRNGTSACNGDSGGGFLIFTPDVPRDTHPNALGGWYLKGIVSQTVSRRDAPICDPEQYVVFTDVSRYKDWIEQYLH